jgi:hypothetical protein
MKDAIAKFDAEAKKIVESFLTKLESYQAPPVVYHYTNDAGLRGILQTGRIWLTDIFSLNDPSELRHGLSRVQTILDQKAETGPAESKIFAKDFSSLDKSIDRAAHYFVCSFSEAGDDLGQWRAYADNGHGYALGFDARALEEAFGKDAETPTSNRAAFPVTYGDAILDDVQRQLIEKMFGLISLPKGRNLSGDVIVAYMVELLTTLASHASHAVLFFKHEAYSNEKEYRFLEVHRADAEPVHELRTRPYSLIRYREFDWKSSSAANTLKQIVIGPAAHPDKALKFARDCMREFYAVGKVDIVPSEIPYRAE